ncbi:hypothetical protein [Microtetraspora malaysiensis]|uniref:hypothetical protein n=1 Tax=Microtetraspora malaysiensis TaxID=161358 RepID=UPI003D8B4FE6
MLSKRVRLALSAGVLGVALTATLTAAANADEAPRPGPVACENADVTVTEQDGKLVATVDGKEVEATAAGTVTAAAVITPAKSVPAAPAASVADADDSGASVGDASAVAPMTEATEVTPAYACASSTATK